MLPDFFASHWSRVRLVVGSFLRFSRLEEITMNFFSVVSTTAFLTIFCLVCLLSQVSQFALQCYKATKKYRTFVYFGCDKILCQTNKPQINILSTGILENYWASYSILLAARRTGLFLQVTCTGTAWHKQTKITVSFLWDIIDEATTTLLRFRMKTHTFFDAFSPIWHTTTTEHADQNEDIQKRFQKWSLLKTLPFQCGLPKTETKKASYTVVSSVLSGVLVCIKTHYCGNAKTNRKR